MLHMWVTRSYCLCMSEEACYDSQQTYTQDEYDGPFLLRVQIQDVEKNFIIDSGANVSVVPKPFALEMGIDYRTCSDN